MSLSPTQIQELALELDQATLEGREMERITVRHPDLSIPDAYLIQAAGIARRFSRGEKQLGLKMGLTSEAKRKQMNLDSPCYGVLTDRMRVEEGSTFSLRGKIHPKIEPEIAFLIKKEIRGIPSYEEALDACSGVCAAMEILDSRYVGFKYFSLPDVVADNSSSSYFVMGRTVLDPRAANWAELEMVMEATRKSGEKETHRALSNAISGDPVKSIIEQCELLNAQGLSLAAGSIVLAGAATQAVQLEEGMQIKLTIDKLGSMSLRVGA
jgi:2-oxo-3-hexenedioate decarboxylase